MDLFHNGTIYMNSIQKFRKIEDNELRGDQYEGVSEIRNYKNGQFRIESLNHTVNFISMHLSKSYPEVYGNIYSLYCISSHGWADPRDFNIDRKIKRFGTHCLMIKDNRKFLYLLKQKLDLIKLKYRFGFVEYYNKNEINGKISVLEKPLEFEYQKEFRLYVERNASDSLQFSIGSMKKISEVFLTDDIVKGLKLSAKV